jgi:type IV pilus assembly protein PilM
LIRDIFKSSTLPIGLDLRSGSARLVQLKRTSGGHTLVARSQVRLSKFDGRAVTLDGLEELTNGLRDCLDSGRFSSRLCVLALGDALVRVRSVRQPEMPRDEANRALRLEGAERLGFDPMTTAQVGWINAGRVRHGDEMREEVILVGCERRALEQIIQAVTNAGLQPRAVEPSFSANARCFGRVYGRSDRKNKDDMPDAEEVSADSGVRVILDVGSFNSSVTVLRDGKVAFYKVIELGGADMNRVTAGQLGLDLETVVELRQRRLARVPQEGSADSVNPKVDRAIFDAVRPLMHELAQEASMCLRYYTVTFCGQRPAFAQIVGEEANEPGLVETIGGQLNINTVIGKPLDGVANLHADSAASFAEWSVATGLCLRGDSRLVGGRAAA